MADKAGDAQGLNAWSVSFTRWVPQAMPNEPRAYGERNEFDCDGKLSAESLVACVVTSCLAANYVYFALLQHRPRVWTRKS